MNKKTILTTLGLLAMGYSAASAAVITWDPVLANTTAGDIITNGTLVVASNSADADGVTINGVPFAAEPAGPLGSNADGTFWTTGTGINTTGDIGLDTLLDSHSYTPGTPSAGSFDILGLTAGQAYAIQIIAVGDTRGCCATRTQSFDGGGSISGDLTRSDPSSVTGYFTADAATQTIRALGSQDGGLSGYQVRAVPEPGSAALLLLGVFGVALRRRR